MCVRQGVRNTLQTEPPTAMVLSERFGVQLLLAIEQDIRMLVNHAASGSKPCFRVRNYRVQAHARRCCHIREHQYHMHITVIADAAPTLRHTAQHRVSACTVGHAAAAAAGTRRRNATFQAILAKLGMASLSFRLKTVYCRQACTSSSWSQLQRLSMQRIQATAACRLRN